MFTSQSCLIISLQVRKFADDNGAFLRAFAISFNKLVNLGYGVSGSKLGSALKAIDLSKC